MCSVIFHQHKSCLSSCRFPQVSTALCPTRCRRLNRSNNYTKWSRSWAPFQSTSLYIVGCCESHMKIPAMKRRLQIPKTLKPHFFALYYHKDTSIHSTRMRPLFDRPHKGQIEISKPHNNAQSSALDHHLSNLVKGKLTALAPEPCFPAEQGERSSDSTVW